MPTLYKLPFLVSTSDYKIFPSWCPPYINFHFWCKPLIIKYSILGAPPYINFHFWCPPLDYKNCNMASITHKLCTNVPGSWPTAGQNASYLTQKKTTSGQIIKHLRASRKKTRAQEADYTRRCPDSLGGNLPSPRPHKTPWLCLYIR